jgi:hypothetical protein
MKPAALRRKNFLFVGSAGGGKAAAIAYALIESAKLNGVDPRLGSPTCWVGSPTTRSPGSTSCCHGVTLPPQRNSRHRSCARRGQSDALGEGAVNGIGTNG